jgi:hypothetical protein
MAPVINYPLGTKSKAGFPILMGNTLSLPEARVAQAQHRYPQPFIFKITIEQVDE